MPKGLFSQGFCLLTDGQPHVGDIASVLRSHDFKVVKEVAGQKEWSFGGPSLVVAYRPEVNGFVEVDMVGRKWPDTMGNPTAETNAMHEVWLERSCMRFTQSKGETRPSPRP